MAGFDFGGATSGASTGSALGPIGAAVGGLLGGFLGGGPKLPPELARLYRLQARAASQLQQFSKSVPLSTAAERAALAQQRGMLGEAQRGQQEELFGALNPLAQSSASDFLMNLTNQQIGQQSALQSQHLLDALARRQQALLQSAQVAQGAAGAASGYQNTGADLGGILGQLAQLYAYRQGTRQRQQQNPVQPGRTAPPGMPGTAQQSYQGPRFFWGNR